MFSRLLHRPADFRLGAVHCHHPGRGNLCQVAAARAISVGVAANGAGYLRLSRRQRQGRGRSSGSAHRAAGQRRREHVLHVVVVRQRRLVQSDRYLSERRRLEHGPSHGDQPGESGHSFASRRHQADRRHHPETFARHPHGCGAHLPEWTLRPALHEQLRRPANQRRARPCARRRGRFSVRSARLPCASG